MSNTNIRVNTDSSAFRVPRERRFGRRLLAWEVSDLISSTPGHPVVVVVRGGGV